MKNIYSLKLFIILSFFTLILNPYSSLIQAANGKITGRVTDAVTGEALPSVNVVITHTVLSEGREVPLTRTMGASTDLDGYFFILNVPPGVYTLKATSVGYNTLTKQMVKVDLDRTITVNFQLTSTEIQVQNIVVTAEREIIKKDVSGTQEVITTARIEQMPVLRMDEFVGKLKGVELVSGEQGNGLSIRGGSIRETDVRMDGISLQDPRSGNSYLGFNSTTVQEMQVLTGGFEAKYGGIRSGLLNVVTKEGQRERYTVSMNLNYTPKGQRRFFGDNPWGQNSLIYKIFQGDYAWRGVPASDTTVPEIFKGFKGWANNTTAERALDSLQKYELWRLQHPEKGIATKPDYYLEGSITGPVPGASIPVWGAFAERSTFLLGFKYEDSQLAFPIGPKDNYIDWNGQAKITTQILSNMKLSVNALYAKTETLSGGQATSYGGALIDRASSFSFLNSSESSVISQASLISGDNYTNMYNLSRLQYYDQRNIVGGAKLTHTISDKAFYTIDFQMGYTDQDLQPFWFEQNGTSDTLKMANFWSKKAKKSYHYYIPDYGSANASTNFADDVLGLFRMFGGTQRIDSSYSYAYQLKGDFTAQIGRHNQFEAGFSAKLQDLFVYTGTWLQSQLAYTPETWQYFKATPLELGLYAQDKLEFEGMILNLGLRLDYFNPMKKAFEVGFPSDPDYMAFYNTVYAGLPGESQGYERWKAFRELLDNPPGWPEGKNKVQVYLSPRLGVSFPITESSKLYFNYGHFYQRPQIAFLYNTALADLNGMRTVSLPSPDLLMGKTVQYEFGYEQMFFDDFIVNVTAYYKDISNEPLYRTYINYYKDNIVTYYTPDKYSDIRGLELRFERPVGRFVSFNAMYDYMLVSSGQTGLARTYEDRVLARDNEIRAANQYSSEPRPRANVTLNLHTPMDFGPETFGTHLLGGIYTNFFFEWKDGGRVDLTPEETLERNKRYIDAVNYWNIDLRASKTFATSYGSLEFTVTVKNLTNNKWLNTNNMSQAQYTTYKNSLKTPDEGGDDKWGEYKEDYINLGWWTPALFLNPRRVILGVRLNI